MRNESLIEWVFRNEQHIRQAIYERRNDDCHSKGNGHGSGVSDPTQAQAIKLATELRSVTVPCGLKGATFKLSNPERWMKVCDKVKDKFGGTVQGELYVLYYKQNVQNKDVIEKLRLSRTVFFTLKNEVLVFAEGVAVGLGIYMEP